MLNLSDRSDRAKFLLIVLLATCLLVGNLWMLSGMLSAQRSLRDASTSLENSQRSLAVIRRLSERPRVASVVEESPTGMIIRVNEALKRANIDTTKKTNISSNPEPLDTSSKNYKEQLHTIDFDGVTMKELIEFCQLMEDPNVGLSVRDLDLSASNRRVAKGVDSWKAKVVLSQLIVAVPASL